MLKVGFSIRMLKQFVFLVLLVSIAFGIGIPNNVFAQDKTDAQDATVQSSYQSAYEVEIAFWQSGLPHYGAFFSGRNGRHQYFTGSSGAPASYSTWNWWGSNGSVLLLEKRWLWKLDGSWSTYPDRWNGYYHHAELDCPC